MVRIREPLTAQQLETTTERWLVIDPVPASVPTVRPLPASSPGGKVGLVSRWPSAVIRRDAPPPPPHHPPPSPVQVSQEADKVIWYSHLFKNFPVLL